MRLVRVFVEGPLREGDRLTLPAAPSHHLISVLRVRSGQPLVVFNGEGRDYSAEVLTATRRGVAAEIGPAGDAEPPLALRVHLGLGISKGERMDFALQKAVELGVARITPLFTDRSVVRLEGERLLRRRGHWEGVVVAACEQSGRRRLPELALAVSLDDWLGEDHAYPILLHHHGRMPLTFIPSPDGSLTLLVGPEGGLGDAERGRAQQVGFTEARLGPRVLRTETAPLAALAVVQALWGDLKD
jgi:16S rRNA (uracil1498-N3)-methyltransferase